MLFADMVVFPGLVHLDVMYLLTICLSSARRMLPNLVVLRGYGMGIPMLNGPIHVERITRMTCLIVDGTISLWMVSILIVNGTRLLLPLAIL